MSSRAEARPSTLKPLRRSVVNRVLWSYALVVLVFALVAGWGALALRRAAFEAEMIRNGYYPLAVLVRDLVRRQDTYNAQLNHITAARNSQDLRVWFQFSRNTRSSRFADARSAIARAFPVSGAPDSHHVGPELQAEVSTIERLLRGDDARLSNLFEALERGDAASAERLHDELVQHGTSMSTRLSRLEGRAGQEIDRLLD